MIKKTIKIIAIIGVSIYLLLCVGLYFGQEVLLFHPTKLDKDYRFEFNGQVDEFNFMAEDGTALHGALFHAKNPKGLIFYLHGNRGSIARYVYEADFYTSLNYDIFIIDYRGYGKSDGKISDEKVLYADNQMAYDSIKQFYNEDSIVILGYSIGTGLASYLAKNNNPKQLILKAPYYSLADMMKTIYPWAPISVLKYRFNNNENIRHCDMPITIFHGDKDQVIYHGSSIKLQAILSQKDTCITLKNQKHHGMTNHPDFIKNISRILE